MKKSLIKYKFSESQILPYITNNFKARQAKRTNWGYKFRETQWEKIENKTSKETPY